MRTNKADWPKEPIKERRVRAATAPALRPRCSRRNRGDGYSHHVARNARARVERRSSRRFLGWHSWRSNARNRQRLVPSKRSRLDRTGAGVIDRRVQRASAGSSISVSTALGFEYPGEQDIRGIRPARRWPGRALQRIADDGAVAPDRRRRGGVPATDRTTDLSVLQNLWTLPLIERELLLKKLVVNRSVVGLFHHQLTYSSENVLQ